MWPSLAEDEFPIKTSNRCNISILKKFFVDEKRMIVFETRKEDKKGSN